MGGGGRAIYKDPVTDDGTERSARGLVRVERASGGYVLHDEQTWAQEAGGELVEVFRDGELLVDWTLAEVRARVASGLREERAEVQLAEGAVR